MAGEDKPRMAFKKEGILVIMSCLESALWFNELHSHRLADQRYFYYQC